MTGEDLKLKVQEILTEAVNCLPEGAVNQVLGVNGTGCLKLTDVTNVSGGGGSVVTNLSYTPSANNGIVNSSTGTGATLPLANTSQAGLHSPTDKTKINALTVTSPINLDTLGFNQGALVSLSGISAGTSNLGTFSGTTIPDGSTIKSALQSLETSLESTSQKLYVSVKSFGVIGDGAVDDTANIQTALNTVSAFGGGVVIFPSVDSNNIYKVSSITIPDNVTISGYGASLVQFKPVAGSTPIILMGNNTKVIGFKRIECLPDNSGDANNGAIVATNKYNVEVSDCYIKNHFFFGVMIDKCVRVTIKNNRFWTDYIHASMTNTVGAWTDSSDIKINSASANGEDVIIFGNRCNSPFTSQGIWVSGTGFDRNISIVQNHCITTTENGQLYTGTNFYPSNTSNAMIRRHGIQIGYGGDATGGNAVISNNICYQTLVTGIYSSGTGLGKGVLISNNICANNGYLNSGLSGSITTTQGIGGDIVIGNHLIDFKGTVNDNGAINISVNVGTTTPNSPTYMNNFILNSGSNAIRITNAPAEVTIKNNLIKNSTRHDIYFESNQGGIQNTVAPLVIEGNRIIRNNLNFPTMYLDNFSGIRKFIIKHNVLTGFSTGVNSQNIAILLRQFNNTFTITNNYFENYYIGIYPFFNYKGRNSNHVINNNEFNDLTYLFYGASDYTYLGQLIGQGNTINNVANINHPSFPTFFQGYTNEAGNITIYAEDIPTGGTWLRGDRILDKTPTAGGVEGWVCTSSGTLGTLASVTGSITTGSTTLNVNDATQLAVGQFITIAGVTGTKRIVYLEGTTVTIDSSSNATVSGAAIAYSAATLKSFGAISA